MGEPGETRIAVREARWHRGKPLTVPFRGTPGVGSNATASMMGTDAPFIGRVDERLRLETLLARLSKGQGGACLVTGEAGLGKSRLVAEVVAHYRSRGTFVTMSTASEYAPAPYAAIRDVLRALENRLPKLLARDPALRQALVPVEELVDSGRGADDPQAARRRTLDAIVAACDAYAAAIPLILIVEDVQWIDAASADALMHLSLGCDDRRLVMLFTLRDDSAVSTAIRDWIERLERRGLRRLCLAPLALDETMALIESCIESDTLDRTTKRTIADLSGGNPLYTIALVEHVAENPRELEQSLPSSLESTVRRRLSAFTSEQRAALRVAALCATFDESLLCDVTLQSREVLRETLRFARDRGVIVQRSGVGFVFRHALFERAICDELMPDERVDMHARIALAIESLPHQSAARLAHHLALSGDVLRSAFYFERAGDEALSSFAYADAAQAFEKALTHRKVDADSVALWERYALAAESAGLLAARIHALEQLSEWAEQCNVAEQAVKYRIELARVRFATADDVAALRDAQKAVDSATEIGNDAITFSALALLAWLQVHQKKLDEGMASIERATPLLPFGDARARSWLYEALAAHDVHSGALVDWRKHCDAMIDEAQGVSLRFHASRLGSAMSLAMSSLVDDYEFALLCAEQSLTLAKGIDLPSALYTLTVSSYLAYVLGDVKRAYAGVSEILKHRDDNIGLAVSNARVGILVGLRLGDDVLIRRCLRDDLLDRAFATKSSVTFGPIAAATAEYLWLSNRRDEASMLVERTIMRLTDGTQNISLLVQASQMEVSPKARLRAREMLLAMSIKSRSATAALHLHDAFALNGEARRVCARRAASGFAELGWRLWEAIAHEIADDRLRARAIYAESGALADVIRLGATTSSMDSFALLTRREGEVAQLITMGDSNRAIAQKLVLTEKTVEHHVTSVLTKLGVKSRAEAIAKLARESQASTAKRVGEP